MPYIVYTVHTIRAYCPSISILLIHFVSQHFRLHAYMHFSLFFDLFIFKLKIWPISIRYSLLMKVAYSSKVIKDDQALSPPERRFTLLLVGIGLGPKGAPLRWLEWVLWKSPRMGITNRGRKFYSIQIPKKFWCDPYKLCKVSTNVRIF